MALKNSVNSVRSTHHSKFFVLGYQHGVRVIVHTANLLSCDCNSKTQGVQKAVSFCLSPTHDEFMKIMHGPLSDTTARALEEVTGCVSADMSVTTVIDSSWPGSLQGTPRRGVLSSQAFGTKISLGSLQQL